MDMKQTFLAAMLFCAAQQAYSSETVTKDVVSACPGIEVAPRTLRASGHYYATHGKFSLREDGITLFDYGTNYNNLGKWANPYFNSNFANALYRDWRDTKCTDEKLKSQFLRVADWYLEEAITKNGMAIWTYPFHNQYFDLAPGWISGIGQARIAGILYRAHAVTENPKYKAAADAAMETYLHDLKSGGVVTFDNGVTWIEEAPDPNGRSYKVLNGHITALMGLTDIYDITKDPRWSELIKQGVAAVKRDLPKFDGGFISFYSVDWPAPTRRTAERGGYNSLHVSQLLWMYQYSGDSDFLKWASHFQSYEMNSDKYEASYSVNSKTNGPERAKALLFGASWTTNEFPTTFTITPQKPTHFKGVAVDALDLARRPIDFDLTAYRRGRVVGFKEVRNNDKLWMDANFKWPVEADKLELEFKKGDRITAITSLMAIRKDIELAPIADECNHRRESGTNEIIYVLNSALDGNPETTMEIRCAGWVFVPMEKGKPYLRVSGNGAKDANFRIKNSWNMKTWSPEKSIPIHSGERIRVNGKYALISFDKDVTEITEIKTSER
ncbi:D-glucuronyl C5-epimerase family protein [Pseudomonas sp. RL_5y_Pfl2_73]|uniref:D-glucuronyl C5-epimerase family protein n=1 Tax=Pseudomonas sp. RL_5y_Pfl2_73 TaxID=3088713 RepID=UPI0030DAA5FD